MLTKYCLEGQDSMRVKAEKTGRVDSALSSRGKAVAHPTEVRCSNHFHSLTDSPRVTDEFHYQVEFLRKFQALDAVCIYR